MKFLVIAIWGRADGTLDKMNEVIEADDAVGAAEEFASGDWSDGDFISAEISITVKK